MVLPLVVDELLYVGMAISLRLSMIIMICLCSSRDTSLRGAVVTERLPAAEVYTAPVVAECGKSTTMNISDYLMSVPRWIWGACYWLLGHPKDSVRGAIVEGV